MEEEKIKIERFEPDMVIHLYDTLTAHNWALRAFGALLESADLENHFGNSNPKAADYRNGLNQIVELYIDHQEKKLNELQDRYLNSPEKVIQGALNTYEIINQGAFRTHEVALENCRRALNSVNLVISEFGEEEYPKAVKARDKLLELQETILKAINGRRGKVSVVEKPGNQNPAKSGSHAGSGE